MQVIDVKNSRTVKSHALNFDLALFPLAGHQDVGSMGGQCGRAAQQAGGGQHTRTLRQDQSLLQAKDHRQQCILKSRDLWQILVT